MTILLFFLKWDTYFSNNDKMAYITMLNIMQDILPRLNRKKTILGSQTL